MHAPTAIAALGVWERGQGQDQTERGLALLTLAYAGASRESLADLSIGERDGVLLSLREAMFGPRLEACLDCPHCGAAMELDFTTDRMRAGAPAQGVLTLDESGFRLSLRPVTSRDLMICAQAGSGDPRLALLSQCLVWAECGGEAVSAADLPAPVIDAASRALSDADPQADVTLNVVCGACGKSWQAPFDILSYLWDELEAWARRMLADVHTLARAYGWREADILALNPLRRRCYLDMVAP
ncbi:MAG TPA: hypothetical protein VMH86_15220 [Rhizomicrobium sp.]|nr:hypothetical protein [Rhizomicrobium sp.]